MTATPRIFGNATKATADKENATLASMDAAALIGWPSSFRMYYGSEFRSREFDAWAADRGIAFQFIQPGKPVESAHVESFNGKCRDECLNQRWFLSLADARFRIGHSAGASPPNVRAKPASP